MFGKVDRFDFDAKGRTFSSLAFYFFPYFFFYSFPLVLATVWRMAMSKRLCDRRKSRGAKKRNWLEGERSEVNIPSIRQKREREERNWDFLQRAQKEKIALTSLFRANSTRKLREVCRLFIYFSAVFFTFLILSKNRLFFDWEIR